MRRPVEGGAVDAVAFCVGVVAGDVVGRLCGEELAGQLEGVGPVDGSTFRLAVRSSLACSQIVVRNVQAMARGSSSFSG